MAAALGGGESCGTVCIFHAEQGILGFLGLPMIQDKPAEFRALQDAGNQVEADRLGEGISSAPQTALLKKRLLEGHGVRVEVKTKSAMLRLGVPHLDEAGVEETEAFTLSDLTPGKREMLMLGVVNYDPATGRHNPFTKHMVLQFSGLRDAPDEMVGYPGSKHVKILEPNAGTPREYVIEEKTSRGAPVLVLKPLYGGQQFVVTVVKRIEVSPVEAASGNKPQGPAKAGLLPKNIKRNTRIVVGTRPMGERIQLVNELSGRAVYFHFQLPGDTEGKWGRGVVEGAHVGNPVEASELRLKGQARGIPLRYVHWINVE